MCAQYLRALQRPRELGSYYCPHFGNAEKVLKGQVENDLPGAAL